MVERDTPLRLVRAWPKMMPGCYEALDQLAGAKVDGEIWWPDYCPLPINAAFTLLADNVGQETAANVAAELTACWMWRQNKIIYRFDPDLAQELIGQADDMEDAETLPVDLLLHLPYPCLYVKAPGLFSRMDGCWAWVDYDTNRQGPELRVQMVAEDYSGSFPLVLHLLPGQTLGASIEDTWATVRANAAEHLGRPMVATIQEDPQATLRSALLGALQLVLYLCAANADVQEEPAPLRPRRTGDPRRVDLIRDKASEVTGYDVGVRVGAALRRSRTQHEATSAGGTGGKKRPHSRRGHWHHYWTGSMAGERTLILKWTAPTMIHADAREDNVVVIPVRGED